MKYFIPSEKPTSKASVKAFLKKSSVGTLFPFKAFEKDYIVMKDGSVTFGFLREGFNIDIKSNDELDASKPRIVEDEKGKPVEKPALFREGIYAGLDAAYNSLKDGVNVQDVVFFSPYTSIKKLDFYEKSVVSTDSLIRELTYENTNTLRKMNLRELENMVFVNYKPITRSNNPKPGILDVFGIGKKYEEKVKSNHEALASEGRAVVESFITNLAGAGFNIQKLDTVDMCNRIVSAVFPEISEPFNSYEDLIPNHELLRLPFIKEPLPWDRLSCGHVDMTDPEVIYINGYYHLIVTAETVPSSNPRTYHDALKRDESFYNLPFQYIVSISSYLPSQEVLYKQFSDAYSRALKFAKRKKDSTHHDPLMLKKAGGAGAVKNILDDKNQKMFFTNITFIIRSKNKDELDRNRDYLLNVLEKKNQMRGLVEYKGGRDDIFRSSIPGYGKYKLRRKYAFTFNLSDLTPVNKPSSGSDDAPLFPFVTKYNSLYFVNPYKQQSHNVMIIGPMGCGKSTLLKFMILCLRAAGVQVIVIDQGDTQRGFCEGTGGRYIAAEGSEFGADVFGLLWSLYNNTEAVIEAILPVMEAMILRDEKKSLEPGMVASIEKSLKDFFSFNKEGKFSDYYKWLKGRNEKGYQEIVDYTHKWGEGSYAKYINSDSEQKIDYDSDYILFNNKPLEDKPELRRVYTILQSLMIEKKFLSVRGKAKAVFWDEGNIHFAVPCQGAATVRIMRLSRTYQTSVITIFHPDVFTSSVPLPNFESALGLSQETKIIGKPEGNFREMQKELSLNEREYRMIASMNNVKTGNGIPDYYVIEVDNRFVGNIFLSPLALAYMSSDSLDLVHIDKLTQELGDRRKAYREHAAMYLKGVKYL